MYNLSAFSDRFRNVCVLSLGMTALFLTHFFYDFCLKLKLRLERLSNFGNHGPSRRSKVKVFMRSKESCV